MLVIDGYSPSYVVNGYAMVGLERIKFDEHLIVMLRSEHNCQNTDSIGLY